jgi:transposase
MKTKISDQDILGGVEPPEVERVHRATIGRPTKYRPEFCDEVIGLGEKGKSIAQIASHFDVDKASIYRWSEEHEAFRTALARARAHAQTWWENAAQQNVGNKNFNAQIWLKSVASRFREDYTDKQVTELSGPNGTPLQVQSQVIDARKLDAEQRAALRAMIEAAKAGEKK